MQQLIIQSRISIDAQTLIDLQRLAQAKDVMQLSPFVYRFNAVYDTHQPQIAQYCQTRSIDFAYLPMHHPLSQYRVLVMDMDSTLITIECIDEIADYIGLKKEVAAITEATMRGEIRDFKESLIARVALLKNTPIKVLEQVYQERLCLSAGAQTMLSGMQQAGIKTALVSGGFTFFTDRLQKQLHFDRTLSNQLEIIDDCLTGKIIGKIVDAEAKAEVLKQMCHQAGCDLSASIAIGDGSNDLKMMESAGLSIAYHAKPIVQEKAKVSINYNGLDAILNLFY